MFIHIVYLNYSMESFENIQSTILTYFTEIKWTKTGIRQITSYQNQTEYPNRTNIPLNIGSEYCDNTSISMGPPMGHVLMAGHFIVAKVLITHIISEMRSANKTRL